MCSSKGFLYESSVRTRFFGQRFFGSKKPLHIHIFFYTNFPPYTVLMTALFTSQVLEDKLPEQQLAGRVEPNFASLTLLYLELRLKHKLVPSLKRTTFDDVVGASTLLLTCGCLMCTVPTVVQC